MIWVRTRLSRSSIVPVPLVMGAAILVPLRVPYISCLSKLNRNYTPELLQAHFIRVMVPSKMRILSKDCHRVQIPNWRTRTTLWLRSRQYERRSRRAIAAVRTLSPPASTIAALGAITEKYRLHGKDVNIIDSTRPEP